MRPSHPPGYSSHPMGQYGAAQNYQQMFQQRGGKTSMKYYPSLSGSETDVSTSTENLTQEERFLLRNMERQEPQGEETHAPPPHYGQQSYHYHPPPPYNDRLVAQQIASNNARREALRLDAMLAMSRHTTPVSPAPGVSALHRGSALPDDLLRMSAAASSRIPVSVTSSSLAAAAASPGASSGVYPTASSSVTSTAVSAAESRLAPSVYSHPSVQDPILKSPGKSFYQDPAVIVPNRGFNISSSGAYFDTSAISRPPTSSSDRDLSSQNDLIAKLTREMKMNGGLSGGSDVESSGSTSTLNNPSATAEKIAALALQAKLDVHNLSSTSTTSGLNQSSLESSKILEMNHKDPPPYESPRKDESKVVKAPEGRKSSLGKPDTLPLSSLTQPDLSGQVVGAATSQETTEANIGSPDAPHYTQEMMEIIIGENRDLKHQLDISKRKIMKLDNLEKEMMKIHEAYSALKEHSEKRELLEKSARSKLQQEVFNMTEMNKELKERHDSIMGQMMSTDSNNIPGLDTILRGEIMRKDALIQQLVGQNKELMAARERQDIELTAQRETIQEHRTHIDVLDSALSNAQTNVLRLEEVKRELTNNLQASGEKRELMEKKLRATYEDEIQKLKESHEMQHNTSNAENFEQLRLKINEYEDKLMRLESEKEQLEKKYLEEAALRQVALEAATKPVEKTDADITEKMMTEKMKHSAELQHKQKIVTDMETQIRGLETKLSERDAIIKILQNRGYDQPSENVLSIPIQDSSSLIFHNKQMSHGPVLGNSSSGPTSHLGVHSSQLSMPLSPPSRHQTPTKVSAAADFFEGITKDMSSTSRGPLTKLSAGSDKVKNNSSSSSGSHMTRSATPSDVLRVSTPTRELIASVKSNRRDSAPSTVLSESYTGKTLINTSELYTSMSQSSSGTLPKMSFAPMKEELSRTLPTKVFPSINDRSPVRRMRPVSSSSSPHRDTGERSGHTRSISRSRERSDQSNMSLDSSLLDNTVNSGVWSRDTLMEALRQEKETRPESYWRV